MTVTATCQRTNKIIPLDEGFFTASASTGEWQFVAADSPEQPGDYDVAVSALTREPAALVDWLAHLHEKSWFDANKFFDFFTAFRKDNNLFNRL